MSSIDLIARNQKLSEVASIFVNGQQTFKLDFLGTITINNQTYFNVFRRYNSVYEIVLEDYNGDLHFHRDYEVYQSLQRVLCLTDEQMSGIYVSSVFSFRHNGEPAISDSFLEMRWSAIQANWQGLVVHLGGILDVVTMHSNVPATPQVKREVHIPDAPEKALHCIPYHSEGAKRQRLTDRFAELEADNECESDESVDGSEDEACDCNGGCDENCECDENCDCDCELNEDDEEVEEYYEDTPEDSEESEESEDEDYVELRSGMKYYK